MADQTYVTIAIWSQVASAILFIAAMGYIWVRWLQPMVMHAQQYSNRQIAEAERHRNEARAALESLREEIEGAGRDAELIRARAERQAERERKATLDETKTEGERLVRNARGELERAREAARVRLRDEIVARAIARAGDEARRRIDESANDKLVERFLSTLERTA